MNEVNGGDLCFGLCVCVCVCAADRWELNANSSKTVKVADFKFHICVHRDSPDITPIFFEMGAWPGSRDPLFLGVKC